MYTLWLTLYRLWFVLFYLYIDLECDPPFYPWHLRILTAAAGIAMWALIGLVIFKPLPLWTLAPILLVTPQVALIPIYQHTARHQPPGWNADRLPETGGA